VAAGTGDIIDITAFKSFTASDALSTISGGTVNGSVTITGNLTSNGNVVLGDSTTDTLNVGNGGLVKDASGNVSMAGTLTTASRGIAKASVPAGTILQVVQSTTVSAATSNSNSYASTGFSVAITPSATSSKILLFCNFGWSCNTADFGFFAFGVNGTADSNTIITCFNQSAIGATNSMYFSSLSYIYSPASVSAQTYTLQFRCSNATTQSLFFNNRSIGGSSGLCTLTAMEIAV
jgi:hypothetical protein